MNQGNSGSFKSDDGVWQDGGLLLHLPEEDRWVAVFLAFQSQSFHTDDTTGHTLPGTVVVAASGLRIVAALVNPPGADPGLESVTLLNPTPSAIDLSGWSLADRLGRAQKLSGQIAAGETRRTVLAASGAQLSNDGGLITLLDPHGLKVHGVAYTKEQAQKQGWTVVF